MKKYLLLFILVLPMVFFAQRRSRYKYEVSYHLGLSNAMTDVGGADVLSKNRLKDFDVAGSRPVVGVSLRYKNSPFYAFKGSFMTGVLYGSDEFTKEQFRNNRNLKFRTSIVEVSGQIEGYFTKEKPAHLYRIKNTRGKKKLEIQAYAFLGLGFFYYNPKGYYQGSWYSLKPLSTEGQGLEGGAKAYSRFSICIPGGIGLKYKIDRKTSFGIEFGMRKTFTDYLDDVSTVYYDKDKLLGAKGKLAAALADPSKGIFPGASNAGETRGGSKEKDTYMFLTFNLSYKFARKKKTRSKF